METELHKRFMEVFVWSRCTSNGLATKIGVNTRTLWNYTCAGRDPNERCLRKICETFPEISEEWLYYGKGEMLKQKEAETQPEKKVPDCNDVMLLSERFESMYSSVITTLEEQIRTLTTQLHEANRHCISVEEQNKILFEMIRESKK